MVFIVDDRNFSLEDTNCREINKEILLELFSSNKIRENKKRNFSRKIVDEIRSMKIRGVVFTITEKIVDLFIFGSLRVEKGVTVC